MLVTLLLIDYDPSKIDDTGADGTISVDEEAGGLSDALDATPSVDGATIAYVTGGSSSALYVIEEGASTALASFNSATNVVAHPDGSAWLVAESGEDHGVYSVPVGGGEPSLLVGTEAFVPLALEIQGDLYFSGGENGVYTVPVAGGGVSVVVRDLPSTPTGIVVDTAGVVYAAAGDTVYEIADGVATAIATGVMLGSPAGVALSPDDSALLVSSLSEVGTAQVLIIDLETLETSIFDDVISANDGAGGLHRAQGVPTMYAWADSSSDGRGGVYRVGF